MMIIDLPLDGGGAVRAGVIGSCRVYVPLGALARRGATTLRFHIKTVFSYTAAEAIQELAYSRGQLAVPDRLAPLVLNSPNADRLTDELVTLVETCQVFLVEISAWDYFVCGDLCFNYPSLANRFVRGAGPAVLAWFRQLSVNPSPPALVAAALDSLRANGKTADAVAEELLTSMVRLRPDAETFDRQVARTIFDPDRRWIFHPLFALPEGPQSGDKSREALRTHVAGAAARAGAELFDLSPLVAQAGRAAALEGGGIDAFHFAPAFLPTVGQALRDLLVGAPAA